MQFDLRKEILEPRYLIGYGYLNFCAMYSISRGRSKIGQFFVSEEVAYYAFSEEDVRIDYVRRFMRKTLYPIINQQTQQPFGGYDRRSYNNSWTPYGKLLLGAEIYETKK